MTASDDEVAERMERLLSFDFQVDDYVVLREKGPGKITACLPFTRKIVVRLSHQSAEVVVVATPKDVLLLERTAE